MKPVLAGLILTLAAAFAAPVFAQSAAQVATGIAPLALAQHGRNTIQCNSVNMHRANCSMPWRDAVLVRQTSKAACIQGRTWGTQRGSVWVDRGCSGVFAEAGRSGASAGRGPGGWAPGAGWDKDIRVRCSSQQYSYNMCQVDTGRGGRVSVNRQLSDTRCVEGRNWGWNRAGVWVDKGCSAEFLVQRRWR